MDTGVAMMTARRRDRRARVRSGSSCDAGWRRRYCARRSRVEVADPAHARRRGCRRAPAEVRTPVAEADDCHSDLRRSAGSVLLLVDLRSSTSASASPALAVGVMASMTASATCRPRPGSGRGHRQRELLAPPRPGIGHSPLTVATPSSAGARGRPAHNGCRLIPRARQRPPRRGSRIATARGDRCTGSRAALQKRDLRRQQLAVARGARAPLVVPARRGAEA